MFADGMGKGSCLAGAERGEEVGARVVEASYLGVVIYIRDGLHFPGPGEIV